MKNPADGLAPRETLFGRLRYHAGSITVLSLGGSIMPNRELERKVYFYRMRTMPDPDGTVPVFNLASALQRIDSLPFDSPTTGRYLLDRDGGNATIALSDGTSGNSHRLRLGTVRRTDLPRVERRGTVGPLSIDPEEGLMEDTHIMFFPGGIVGAEFNFHGPRLGRFEDYLRRKLPDMPTVRFHMLLQRDMAQQLQRMEDVRMVRLSLRREYSDLLRHASANLPDAFNATDALLRPPVIELCWRGEPRARKGLGQAALDFLVRLVGEEQRLREGALSFQARALDNRTHRVNTFDLLKDKLVSTQRVVASDARHRGVDHHAMFSAIE